MPWLSICSIVKDWRPDFLIEPHFFKLSFNEPTYFENPFVLFGVLMVQTMLTVYTTKFGDFFKVGDFCMQFRNKPITDNMFVNYYL